MNYEKSKHSFLSANRVDSITYYIYTPACKPRAVIQICHGMYEYSEKYEHFIDFLCGRGYAVMIHDCLGHGNSVSSENDLGFFALRYGWIYLIKDLRHVQMIGKSLFGGIPHFFIGHSMGSLIIRCLLARWSCETGGAVMLGTVGVNPGADIGIALADREIMLYGVKSRSHKLNRLLFGMTGARIEDKRTEFDWVSRDEQAVSMFINDKKSNFIFTASAFRDLFMLIDYCTSRSWYKKVRRDIPMLLMSGTDDPVGMYGRGVMRFYRGLEKHGFSDVGIRLWDGCRHDLLSEINRFEVYDEIDKWLSANISRIKQGK